MPITLQNIDEPAVPHPLSVTPNHIALSVPDVDASIEWYRQMLGFRLEFRAELRTDNAELRTRTVFMERNGFRVELHQMSGASPLPASCDSWDKDLMVHGTKHFAFTVPDITQATNFLRSKGVDIAWESRSMPDAVVPACMIRDNSGICIELIEEFSAYTARR